MPQMQMIEQLGARKKSRRECDVRCEPHRSFARLFFEAITVTTYGFDDLRIVASSFDLVAKTLDVRIDRLRFRDELPAPGFAQQVFTGRRPCRRYA